MDKFKSRFRPSRVESSNLKPGLMVILSVLLWLAVSLSSPGTLACSSSPGVQNPTLPQSGPSALTSVTTSAPCPGGVLPEGTRAADASPECTSDFSPVPDTLSPRQTGDLWVSVVTVDPSAASGEDTLPLILTLSDRHISGQFGEMEFREGISRFSLKDGTARCALGLPAGISYEIRQADTGTEGSAVSPEAICGRILPHTLRQETFRKARPEIMKKTGTVLLSLKMQGPAGGGQQPPDFRVSLSDQDVNGRYGDGVFTDGTATVTLRHGQTLSLTGLPSGVSYAIEATPAAGKSDFTLVSANRTGVVPEEDVITASFVATCSSGRNLPGSLPDRNPEVPAATAKVPAPARAALRRGAEPSPGTLPEDTPSSRTLTVEQLILGTAINEKKSFRVQVHLFDEDAEESCYGEMQFRTGFTDFFLGHNETRTATGLPEGASVSVAPMDALNTLYTTYVRVEADGKPADFERFDSITSVNCDFTRGTHYKVTIKAVQKTGNLTVENHVTGPGPDTDRAFRFSVDLTQHPGHDDISGQFGEMQFTGGHAEFTLKDGQQKTASGIPIYLSYTVHALDVSPEEYETTLRGETGRIQEDITAVCTITNKTLAPPVETGSLKISKTVLNSTADESRDFRFQVDLEAELDGQFGQLHLTGGSAQFSLKHRQSILLTNLPAGTPYRVRELDANQDGYETTGNRDTGIILANEVISVEFHNRHRGDVSPPPVHTGTLAIGKTVSGTAGEPERLFRFNVTLDAPLEGQFGALQLTGGTADFTLKHADRILLSDLPAGTGYRVTELDADQDGYVTSSTGATGTIRADQVHEALFHNVKDQPEPPPLPTGSLVIGKTVSGTAGEPDRLFRFSVTLDAPLDGQFGSLHLTGGRADFTLKHADRILLSDLPAGTGYTVTELDADQDGYVTSSTGAAGTIRAEQVHEALFRNVKDLPEPPPLPTGSLVIRKTVSGTAGEPDRPFHFKILLNSPLEGQFGSLHLTGGSADFTLKHGGSVLLTDLPAGTVYTVTELEADQDGYVTGSTGATGTIRADEIGEVSFRNVKDQPESEPLPTGSLVIRKTVSGTAGEPDRLFHFSITLDAPLEGQFGSLQLTGGTGDFTLKHGGSVLLTGLPAGTVYTVTELEADQDGYVTGSTGAVGTIRADELGEVSFRNVKDQPESEPLPTGSLVIRKTVSGTAGEPDRLFHFTIVLNAPLEGQFGNLQLTGGTGDFTLKHGDSIFLSGLPAGTVYTVTEQEGDQDGYRTESTGATGQIIAGEITEVSFLNVRDPVEPSPIPTGSLTIRKTVSGTGGDRERQFRFRVTLDRPLEGPYGEVIFSAGRAEFSLKHGEQISARDLPAGLNFNVEELDADSDGYITSSTGALGTIQENRTAEALFLNHKSASTPPEPRGSLVVRKILIGAGSGPDESFEFRMELDDPTIEGVYGGMNFHQGTAEFTLRHQEALEATDLPANVHYQITERSSQGYEVQAYGDTGTIPEGGVAYATFFNLPAHSPAGSLTVTKKVSGDAGDADGIFHFTVTLKDRQIQGIFGEMIFTDGEAAFTLRGGETCVASGLPAGTEYTVTEQEANEAGCVTLEWGTAGTIPDSGSAFALFENIYQIPRGTLVIRKTVEGTRLDRETLFHFTLTLEDTSIEGRYGELLFHRGKASFALRHGQSVQATGLPAGIRYFVEEAKADQKGFLTETSGTEGTIGDGTESLASFTNIRKPTTLKVTKLVAGSREQLSNVFLFSIRLSDSSISGSFGDVTFTHGYGEFLLGHSESIYIHDLPEGISYTIREVLPSDPAPDQDVPLVVSKHASGVISSDDPVSVLFTNYYDQIDDLPEDPPNAPESPDHPSELPPEIPPETPPETPPEIPQNPVPLNPEVPHQPNLPVEPEIPDLTEPPYVPDIPDAPEVPYGPPLIPDIPQTGEPIGSRIFGLLMLASLLGLAALNLRGHRKPK